MLIFHRLLKALCFTSAPFLSCLIIIKIPTCLPVKAERNKRIYHLLLNFNAFSLYPFVLARSQVFTLKFRNWLIDPDETSLGTHLMANAQWKRATGQMSKGTRVIPVLVSSNPNSDGALFDPGFPLSSSVDKLYTSVSLVCSKYFVMYDSFSCARY